MTWIQAVIFAFLLVDLSGIYGRTTVRTCESPQYIEMGSTSTVRCDFYKIYAAYWYETTESGTNPPVLLYEDSEKSGSGIDSREYDVHPDGSLIINRVTLKHDVTFRVIFLLQRDGNPSQEDIRVVVIVLPDQSFPVIDKCEGERTCFKQLQSNTPITCTVNNAKPAVDLTWVKRTKYGDTPMSSSQDVINANNRHTTIQTINGVTFNGISLLLLICKSEGPPSLLQNSESAILLENSAHITTYEEISVKEVFSGSSLLLPCNDTESLAIVWHRENDVSVTLIAKSFHGKFRIVDEYDLTEDGALVMQQVGLDHEGIYKCMYSDGVAESLVAYRVVVHVRPAQSFPVIEECGQARFCNRQIKNNVVLRCTVRDARPSVALGWYRRTTKGLEKIPSTSYSSQNDKLYTSYEDTIATFDTTYISVLVCQSLDEPSLLSIKDSLILIENLDKNVSSAKAASHYVQQHSRLELDCDSTQMVYAMWKKRTENGIFQTLLFVSLDEKETVDGAYYVKGDHGLAVDDVSVQHEGTYICIYGDGRKEYEQSYNAIVYINPEPYYLVVDGCGSQQYCVLTKGRSGNITCSVRGIRPEVDLEWTTADQKQLQVISFTSQKILKNSNGETFDVEVTSSFLVNDLGMDRLTIECRTSGPNSEIFNLKTTLDLMFTEDNHTATQGGSMFIWILLIVLVTILIVIAMLLFWFYRKRKGKVVEVKSTLDLDLNEYTKMMPSDDPDGQTTEVPLNDVRYLKRDKKGQLIDELKDKYKNWTSDIRPLPSYGRRLQFEVNDIFVDSGIKMLAPRRRGMIQDEWHILKSYHDIFQIASTRIIVEGDPGFGKSTMMLKAAHDWSTGSDQSLLKNTDIFILLPLRKLGAIKSLYSAIRKTLLPKESLFNEHHIEQILLSTDSVVLALDDFDEYPDRESKVASHFHSIIAGDMLNQVKVILLTRTTCLPDKYRPDTQFVRLTGFNRTLQDQYITKAFSSRETLSANALRSNLEMNTIMNDIAKVPMFFAMFAHVKSWSDVQSNFSSASQFFKYVIDEIESRLKEKVDDKGSEDTKFYDTDYVKLGKVVLQAFCNKEPLTWTIQALMSEIGEDTCVKFLTVGILVQENNGLVSASNSSHKLSQKEVKFYHTLFGEWYAAQFLVKRLEKRDYEKILRTLNPFDLQYLYRFTCALNDVVAKKIISYLKSGENGDKFAILCELEKTGNVEHIKESLTKMCSSIVSIYGRERKEGSRLLRKSTTLLLEIASKNEIPIKSVLLDRCVNEDEAYPDHLGVGPDSFMPPLKTLAELRIYNVGRHLSQGLSDHILRYCSICGNVRTLQFLKTFQPHVVLEDEPDILATLHEMEITVTWTPLKKKPEFLLDLQNGKWKDQKNENELSEDDHKDLLEKFNKLWNDDTTT